MKPLFALVVGILVGWSAGWLFEMWWGRKRRGPRGVPEAAPATSQEIELPRAPVTTVVGAEPASVATAAAVAGLQEREDAPPDVDMEQVRAAVQQQPVDVAPEIERQASIGDELPEGLPETVLTDEALAAGPVEVETEAPAGLSESALAATAPSEDDLTVIEGIGPVYATKLREAGITSFARLADSNPQELAGIIQAPSWRKMYFEEWIEQAALLRDQEHERLKELQARLFRRKKQ